MTSATNKEWGERHVSNNEAHKHYVSIFGYFHSGKSGHLGLYQGSISGYLGFEIIEYGYYSKKEQIKKEVEREKWKEKRALGENSRVIQK